MDTDSNKRPRLDTIDSLPSSPKTSLLDSTTSFRTPMMNTANKPFSNVLANLGRQTKHQLSDKKLMVYDLKVDSPSLPEGYDSDAWNRLQEAVYAIQRNNKPSESLEALYQICENLCQHNHSQQIYNELKEVCGAHIGRMFAALENDPSEGTQYLETVNTLWTTYSDQMNQIRCIFLYLDRSYRSILELAIELFCTYYLQSPLIREKVVGSILDMISSERNEVEIDASLLKHSLRMLMDLNLYSSEFEGRFLDQTRQFYMMEGDRLIEEMNMSAYLEHVAKRVHQECTLRMKHYFDKSSKAPITAIVEDQLLSNRVHVILDKGFNYFMDTRQEDDLSLLYRLLKKVDKLDICAKYFMDYVKAKGTSILKDHSTVKDTFAILLSFIRKVNTVVRHSFEEDELFLNGCKDSIAYFINLRQNNAPKLLANYTDAVLRNDKVDEKALETCMVFFRILQSKDAFEVFYKQDLAKRLILDVGSNKMENAMLARMMKECGPAYTSKLDKMLKDMKHSSELMVEFKEQDNNNFHSTNLHLEVKVLTYGFWPSDIPNNVTLPRQFQLAQDEFNAFYTDKHPKRRLTWQNTLSVCEVKSNYYRGTHNITLTLHQTVILLIFNDTSRRGFTFGEILAMTNLDELELQRTLKSLACGRYALLLKQPAGPDVEQTDYFMYNDDFESNDTFISMNTEKLNEAIENNASIDATVLITREQQVDAAIVRLLKAKQSLSHGALLGEVTRQIRFPVTALEVKQRIELLIEKEYIERTDDNGYKYT
ncbi:Cullin family-domain-containing protein [Chlamydoabsidia padenii]|nr:Cullin family-domain-containing protein [Chlamydoabsidia padenii]